jgi:CheY-like chemotaxis protein
MATILLVEDVPDLGLYEARLLEDQGHRVIRCGGAPSPLAACPMVRHRPCPLPEVADLIVFSTALYKPTRHRMYRGIDLLTSYRAHPVHGRTPMLVVAMGVPRHLVEGARVEVVEKFSEPRRIIDAVERLLASGRAPVGATRA